MGRRHRLILVVLGFGLQSAGCQRSPSEQPRAEASLAPALTSSPDRLSPRELTASSRLAFGFPIPDGLRIERAFDDAIHLIGQVEVEPLLTYLRQHATLGPIELLERRMLISDVRFQKGDPSRVYRMEITDKGPKLRLVIRDITPKVDQTTHMTDEERWRHAGLRPNGEPLDKGQLQ